MRGLSGLAQDSAAKNPLTLSGYAEVYYSYDLAEPQNHERPWFFYNFRRHNEVSLNLGYLKASYKTAQVRGALGLMAGTYAQYNLSAEHPVFQHLYEAYAGFSLSEKHDLWLDAGVMPSHIGFESAVGVESWNLTRSLLAENSPYYESGAKLGYTSNNGKLYAAGMYLNGWQRIRRLPGNNTPAFGTQLTLKPGRKVLFNWSTFIGNDKPDSSMAWRYFNNFYGQFRLSEKLGLIAGFDIGWQQSRKPLPDAWYSPVVIVQLKPFEKLRLCGRIEYYSDEKGVIIATGTPHGFRTMGYSLNCDYTIHSNVLWRIEARTLNSRDKLFTFHNRPSNQNYFFTTSLAISLF